MQYPTSSLLCHSLFSSRLSCIYIRAVDECPLLALLSLPSYYFRSSFSVAFSLASYCRVLITLSSSSPLRPLMTNPLCRPIILGNVFYIWIIRSFTLSSSLLLQGVVFPKNLLSRACKLSHTFPDFATLVGFAQLYITYLFCIASLLLYHYCGGFIFIFWLFTMKMLLGELSCIFSQ